MNAFEFTLTAIGMVIIGVWGLIIISKICGLTDDKDKK